VAFIYSLSLPFHGCFIRTAGLMVYCGLGNVKMLILLPSVVLSNCPIR